jgi:FAD/FMN-containing dehydrogenase
MTEIESQLAQLLGADALATDPTSRERYLVDWTRSTSGTAHAIVRPSSAADVARCVAWCWRHGIGVVPQGGHTGLAGGATPTGVGRQIVLSLERLNKIRQTDTVSNTMVVEAGVILQQVQQEAEAHGRLFPLSLGAEGTCQIGGCISTNAGGTAVLRYGNMRDLVLGLEVVLPDGTIWTRLKTLRKDNAGFDLKHLFIGSEGTLGVVTAAALRIFPKPQQTSMAMVSAPTPEAVLDLFSRVRDHFDAELTAFEFMSGACMRLSCAHLGRSTPVAQDSAYAVMLEISSPHSGDYVSDALQQCLATAMEAGGVTDAVLATNEHQATFFWALRETIPEAMLRLHGQHFSGHDISLPIAHIPVFLHKARQMLEARWPLLDALVFGHVGDGNLHVSFVPGRSMVETSDFRRMADDATDAIYQLTDEFGGSISAEHGTGLHKREFLHRFSPPAQTDLMRKVKDALDPEGLMNPGKVFLE